MLFREVFGDFERRERDSFRFEVLPVVAAEEAVLVRIAKEATPFKIESSRSVKKSLAANGYRITDSYDVPALVSV